MLKGYNFLSTILESKSLNDSGLAEILKISPQAVNSWKSNNEIPTKRVSQIADIFKLSLKEIDLLLGNIPLEFDFRNNRGVELDQNRVPAHIRTRAEVIFERFFQGYEQPRKYDLTNLRNKIVEANSDFKVIADAIREEFMLPDYIPLEYVFLNKINERVNVRSYFLPFKSIGLEGNDDSAQSAILYNKNEHYVILVDSDRKIDEAHFDQLHELIHIFFHNIEWKLSNSDLEKLIDKICGELIYPQRYMVEKFFNNEPNSKPITDKIGLVAKFWDETKKNVYVLSPKGLARAMRDIGLTTESAELFKYLSHEVHSEFRDKTFSYTEYGSMDIDFKNPSQVVKFYEFMQSKQARFIYPLFDKIKKDVLSGCLSVVDFADTFAMKLEDALLVQAKWIQEGHVSVGK